MDQLVATDYSTLRLFYKFIHETNKKYLDGSNVRYTTEIISRT